MTSCVLSIICGGALSGCLHSLSGPDHMAALFPSLIGRKASKRLLRVIMIIFSKISFLLLFSAVFGGIWGLGHGLASILVGLAVFKTINYINDIVSWKMQGVLNNSSFSDFITNLMDCEDCYKLYVDFIMGFTLLIVGIVGIRESSPTAAIGPKSSEQPDLGNSLKVEDKVHGYGSNISLKIKEILNLRSCVTFLNGFVMGMSWDGIPSLTPAAFVGVGTDSSDDIFVAVLYLVSYAAATVLSMSAICAVFGEATCWLYRIIKQQQRSRKVGKLSIYPEVSADLTGDDSTELIFKLSYNSSCISLIFGLLWMLAAMMKYMLMTSTALPLMLLSSSQFESYTQAVLSVGCVAILATSTVWTVAAEFDWSSINDGDHRIGSSFSATRLLLKCASSCCSLLRGGNSGRSNTIYKRAMVHTV